MKKWSYLVSGIIIGALGVTAGTTTFADVKSLIGKKVTDEYVVVVDGKALSDKGAVIDGKTNVPVRGMAQALGVDFKVEGKKIVVTTDEDDYPVITPPEEVPEQPVTNGNEYMGDSKKTLEELKYSIENRRLALLYKEREGLLADIEVCKNVDEDLRKQGLLGSEPSESLEAKEKELADIDRVIAEDEAELRLVNEALEAHSKK